MAKRFYKNFEFNSVNDAIDDAELELIEVKPTDSKLVKWLKAKTLTGFKGHSLFDVGKYFFRSLFKETLTIRASSLAFNFFLALFPLLIFLLTLMAYLPVTGVKTRLLYELKTLLPDSSYKIVKSTILEIIKFQNGGLLSMGFILALYFSSNAFHTLINTFNRQLPVKKRRGWIKNRLRAILLTVIISLMVIVMLLILTYLFKLKMPKFLFLCIEYFFIGCGFFAAVSCIYYYGPSHINKWRFFSPGSIFASVFTLLSTVLFGIYVNSFNAYSKIYGGIGSFLALMVLVYINMLLIIVGFELNASIEKAVLHAENAKDNSE